MEGYTLDADAGAAEGGNMTQREIERRLNEEYLRRSIERPTVILAESQKEEL